MLRVEAVDGLLQRGAQLAARRVAVPLAVEEPRLAGAHHLVLERALQPREGEEGAPDLEQRGALAAAGAVGGRRRHDLEVKVGDAHRAVRGEVLDEPRARGGRQVVRELEQHEAHHDAALEEEARAAARRGREALEGAHHVGDQVEARARVGEVLGGAEARAGVVERAQLLARRPRVVVLAPLDARGGRRAHRAAEALDEARRGRRRRGDRAEARLVQRGS